MRKITSWILWTLVCAWPVAASSLNPSLQEEWKKFRHEHPYHIQVVALSEPDGSGHRLLLITEPPPHVSVQGLERLEPKVLQDVSTGRHPIGYDGWVKDVLFEIPAMSDGDLDLLLSKIHQYMFGTSYKASAVRLSSTVVPGQYQLDLHVPAGNIALWLLGSDKTAGSIWPIVGALLLAVLLVVVFKTRLSSKAIYAFSGFILAIGIVGASVWPRSDSAVLRLSPTAGGSSKSLKAILRDGRSGVFVSDDPGLVVWSFPRHQSLSDYQIEARQFALDSDLVLGAVANENQVAVVARERAVPVDLLPPLRVETIMMLAAADTDELAQSYERMHILAGKFDENGGWDWAPIYLSPQLIDTEYGSLLNITDQLLKSWSEHGEVRYINFNYPDPDVWPFPQALHRHIKAETLTFNWNTKGVGYSATNEGLEVFALNKTGSLPVDYLALDNERMRDAENVGYDYFSGRNDPNLVRVVQYASLYQLFRRFSVNAAPSGQVRLPVSESLKSAALAIINVVYRLDENTVARLKQESVTKELGKSLMTELEAIAKVQSSLSEFLSEFGEEGRDTLANYLVSPRDFGRTAMRVADKLRSARSDAEKEAIYAGLQKSEQIILRARVLASDITKHGEFLQWAARIPLSTVMRGYVSNMERSVRGWIRTPSIVVSRTVGKSFGGVGGHNLDSAISVFRTSEEVGTGEIKVIEENGRKIVLYNEKDSSRVGELSRAVGRDGEGKTADELEQSLRQGLREAKGTADVPRLRMLALDGKKLSTMRGLDDATAGNVAEASGFRPTLQEASDEQTSLTSLMSGRNNTAIVVERVKDSGGYIVFHNASRRIFRAADSVSAQDALVACLRGSASEGTPVYVHLRGFDARQGRGFLDTAELQMGKVRPKEIIRTIDEARISSSELENILKTEYDFKTARIEEVRTIAESEAGTEVEATVKIDAASAAKPPLLMRIRMFFERTFTNAKEFVATIQTRISEFLTGLGSRGGSIDWVAATSDFLKDMEKTNPGVKFQVTLSHQSRDVHIVYDKRINLGPGTAYNPA